MGEFSIFSKPREDLCSVRVTAAGSGSGVAGTFSVVPLSPCFSTGGDIQIRIAGLIEGQALQGSYGGKMGKGSKGLG